MLVGTVLEVDGAGRDASAVGLWQAERMALDPGRWQGRRVLVTGHTGFKGAWLSFWLRRLGAEVTGLALPPVSVHGAFSELDPPGLRSVIGDIRDPATVREAVDVAAPSVVFHLAAEAIVRRAHQQPVPTFETNVLGTVHLLDALRNSPTVEAVIVITSDKVYADATERPAVEADPLGSDDVYSSSKACVELLVRAWRTRYLSPRGVAVATARAGNVIGGGDTSPDRLVPDVLRADVDGEPVVLRAPGAVRPWQHVLDPLHGYLLYAQHLLEGHGLEGHGVTPTALNFGPDELGWTVRDVVEYLQAALGRGRLQTHAEDGPLEAPALLLSSELSKRVLGWQPAVGVQEALRWSAEWHRTAQRGGDLRHLASRQVSAVEQRVGVGSG
jgi:CDP-glucose 4,6-dehydratase